MSPSLRALAFFRRFAPFWMVWLLIFLLPASREPLQFQLLGSPFTPDLNPSWAIDERLDPRFDAFAAARRSPSDLNARVWRFSQMLEGKAAGFGANGAQNRQIYKSDELLAEAEAILRDFPREKWLGALSMRVLRLQMGIAKAPTAARLQQTLTTLQNAQNAEPQNAFYPLMEAEFRRTRLNDVGLWRALDRAATRTGFDTHDLEWAHAIVSAHDAARPLLIEEREALWRDKSDSGGFNLNNWPRFLIGEARLAQKSGDHRRAVEIGAMMLQIGDLMQRGPNSRAMAEGGQIWKTTVNELIFRVYPPPRAAKNILWARSFPAYGAAHGRPDVAALFARSVARQKQLLKLSLLAPAPGFAVPPTPRDAFYRVAAYRNAGAFVGVHLWFVAAFWLLVNLVMWRGAGAPSNRIDRVMPALAIALLMLSFALWSWHQFELLDGTRWTPGREKYYIATATVGIVAFFGPPFLLAIWAAASTLWRHKREFLRPARIETELRLNPREVTILKSGPALLCTASLLFTLGFWLFYLLLVALGINSFDILSWLPDDGRLGQWSFAMPTEMLLAPLTYCLFCNFVGFLLWFNKWRYYGGKESRPLTHGGLRAWKETLGIYLVIGSAIYLGVALVGAGWRSTAARELAAKMTRGELPL